MRFRVTHLCLLAAMLMAVVATEAAAQSNLDPQMDTLRRLSSVGPSDQRRIAQWIQAEFDGLKQAVANSPDQQGDADAFRVFRQRLGAEYGNPQNSSAFQGELISQTSQIAIAEFANPNLDATLSWSLARVLVDFDSPQVVDGLLAGLSSKVQTTRYLCSVGLGAQKVAIAADQNLLQQCVAALQTAGLTEDSAVVLSYIYIALSMENQLGVVLDPILAILDQRLAKRRDGAKIADRAEVDILEFFGQSGVAGALSPAQKAKVVSRLAVFFRLDAQRYQVADLAFGELDALERRLAGGERAIRLIVGGQPGGNATKQLADGGHANRATVLQEVYKWIGHPEDNTQGVLNGAPWNVPVGAP